MIQAIRWIGDPTKEAVAEALDSSRADMVVADIEDTVAPSRKTQVREILCEILENRSRRADQRPLWVRPNAIDTSRGAEDVAALVGAGVDGLVIPKAMPEILDAAYAAGSHCMIALAETAEGIERISDIARSPGVERLELGALDLTLDLNTWPLPQGLELAYARARIVIASRAARLPAPIDATFPSVEDLDSYRAVCEFGRAMGYGAAACLTEEQVELALSVFGLSDEQINDAKEVVAAYDYSIERGEGVARVAGRIIERPEAERARRLLADVASSE